MEKYEQMKARHQKEIDALPMYFAFGQNQFEELMKKLGFENEEEFTKSVFTIGAGSIILKKDRDAVLNTFLNHDKEMIEAFENDEFLQSAFEYELANHEYIITYELDDTLRALGIKQRDYQASERMQNIMKIAIGNYKKEMERFGW